mgnify:CR=1 FL=1
MHSQNSLKFSKASEQMAMLNDEKDHSKKLQQAVSTASSMFESNVQCLSHILALKKELSLSKEVEVQLAHDSNEMKHEYDSRINELETTIKVQNNELNNMKNSLKSMNSLKGAWNTILSPTDDLALPIITSSGNMVLLRSPQRRAKKRAQISDSTAAAAALGSKM